MTSLRTRADQRWYRLSLLALIVAAWLAVAGWGASPYAGLLDHSTIGESDLSPIVGLITFSLGWVLMTVAMMLPSSLPLLNLFQRIVRGRADSRWLVLLLGAGYLLVWAYFGVLAYAGDAVLHGLVGGVALLREAAGGIGAAVMLVAGIYQFTPLKTLCLDKCRSPLSFIAEHWRGGRAWQNAFRLGLRHGLFCVGCCWTLMLLMFAVGGVNLGWMLLLSAVMAAERATRWGRSITRPVGGLLIVGALVQFSGALP